MAQNTPKAHNYVFESTCPPKQSFQTKQTYSSFMFSFMLLLTFLEFINVFTVWGHSPASCGLDGEAG